MDTNKPLSLFLVAVLVASVFSVVGIMSLPLQKVAAQTVTIETSVDELGGTFFGHGAVQVIIDDEDTNDDEFDEISVNIDIEGDGGDFEIPNTSDGSQRFEFFLVHEDSDFNDSLLLDGIATTPTIITWGPGGNITSPELMFDEVTIDIDYGNEDVTLNYEETPADFTTDRDLYGSESIVYMLIEDQDANNNPTEVDEFELTDAVLNDDLFEIDGGSFDSGDSIVFEETGDNSGIFEAEVSLLDDFDATADTVEITLNDQAAYDTTLLDGEGNPIAIEDDVVNDSPDTAPTSFEIDNVDGTIDAIPELTFSSELVVTVRDNDQNRDSDEEDTIVGGITVTSEGPGGDFVIVDLEETGDNTGVFEADLSNGEIEITFCEDESLTCPDDGNSVLELTVEDITEDIFIEYTDELADNEADDGTAVASRTLELTNTPGQVSAPEEVGVTDEFTVTVTDPDLNDDSGVRDSYAVLLDGTSPFPLTRGGLDFSNVYEFEIEADGEALTYADEISITLRETTVDSGIFEMSIDVEEDITEGAGVELSDGDDIDITIHDFMDDADDSDEDTASITIGRPSTGIDYDRTAVPIPPNDDADALDVGLGGDIIVRLLLNDATLGTESNEEESFEFLFGTDAGEFTLEVDGDDVDDCEIGEGEGLGDCDLGSVTLDEILEIGDLEETGENTNVFEAELTFFDSGAGFDTSDLQDAEFTFTFNNDEGDEDSAGFTFRGSDGIVTVDQPSAKAGTIVTVTVEDQDLNTDTDEADSFESTVGTEDPFLVAIEGEDDDIDGGDTQTFEETGDDTGVFTAEFEVGEDILIVDLEEGDQASNILITYNDEIDSTGGNGDEIEVNVPVVSGTGSIQITPELVGPATTITVLIVDSDLDEDANSVDEYTEDDTDDMVEFASSRNEVDEAIPDIEETGPNTGVFMFTIELITDEDACADDDLSDEEFDAEGGDTESTIGACPGDLISVRYEDEVSGSGGSATVSEVVEVNSWDPEFVADKDSYSIGDRVTVTISDPDGNRDSDIADSLTDIRVSSDSDQVGEEFSAIETGRDTGVFRLTFGTTQGTAGGAISVKQGDDITVRYTDEFPADFVDEEEDKDFDFVITVGGADGTDATTVTPPEVQDVTGQELDEISAGQQVVLTTSVRNNNAGPQEFVALVEVRDDTGVTVFLAWQTGTLPANGQTQVGLSWIPEDSGDYEVRTFVISDLDNPRVLSLVSTSNITVN